jgi:hypothetical protein
MITLDEVVIIGGGCYGSFYAGQLARARRRGAATWAHLRVVDHDPACRAAALIPTIPDSELVVEAWEPFLDHWLAAPRSPADQVVPSPLMPHLMATWIERQARHRWPGHAVAMVPAAAEIGTPFDRLHPGDGVRYVSWADWLCPVHCIEPATCPVIAAPRTWEMGDAVAAWTSDRARERPTVGPALFACRHVVYGVGMYPAVRAREALELLAEGLRATPAGVDLVVASVSACHGAVGILRTEAQAAMTKGGG